MQSTLPVTGSVTIRDEKGTQYVLKVHEPGSAPGVTNVPPAKIGYAIMEVYGIGVNGSGTLIDSDGENYSIYNYTGYIGGSHYFYIKPGTYTVKAIGTSGNYIYIDINGMKKYLSEGTSFTIPSVGSSISLVFSTKPI